MLFFSSQIYLCEHLPHVPVGDAVALRTPARLGVPELVHQTHLTREQSVLRIHDIFVRIRIL
jgi:hypothetical protein